MYFKRRKRKQNTTKHFKATTTKTNKQKQTNKQDVSLQKNTMKQPRTQQTKKQKAMSLYYFTKEKTARN